MLSMLLRVKNIYVLICLLCSSIVLFSQNDSTNNNKLDQDELNWQLILTADSGNADRVLYLLKQGADVNTSTPYENITPLMYASQSGDLKTVKVLVANGAEINAQPLSKETALLTAVKFNFEDITLYLLDRGANPSLADSDGNTPLHFAVLYNYPVIVDMLLYYGADINVKNNKGYTPLMIASYYGNYTMTDFLINKGANVNYQDNYGYTAIMFAAQMGYYDIVKLLLENGADVNISAYNGVTVLTLAIRNDYNDIAGLILSDKNFKKQNSKLVEDPYKIAIMYNRKEIIDTLKLYGYKNSIWPLFDRIAFSYGFNMNLKDLMFQYKLGILEQKYNTGFYLSMANHYWPKRILFKENDTLYYQFNQFRSFLAASIEERFNIGSSTNFNKGAFIGFKVLYTYGRNEGMDKRIDNNFIYTPQFGVFMMSRNFAVRFNYEYVPFDITGVPASRFNIDLVAFINLIKKQNANKYMYY